MTSWNEARTRGIAAGKSKGRSTANSAAPGGKIAKSSARRTAVPDTGRTPDSHGLLGDRFGRRGGCCAARTTRISSSSNRRSRRVSRASVSSIRSTSAPWPSASTLSCDRISSSSAIERACCSMLTMSPLSNECGGVDREPRPALGQERVLAGASRSRRRRGVTDAIGAAPRGVIWLAGEERREVGVPVLVHRALQVARATRGRQAPEQSGGSSRDSLPFRAARGNGACDGADAAGARHARRDEPAGSATSRRAAAWRARAA